VFNDAPLQTDCEAEAKVEFEVANVREEGGQ